MKAKTRSLIELNLASVLLGSVGLFAKLIQLPAHSIIFGRMLIAGAGLAVLCRLTEGRLRLKEPTDYGHFIFTGILMAAHWVTFFLAIQFSTVAIAMIALFTYPLFTVFAEPIFNRESPTVRDIVMAGLAFAGVVIMTPSLDFENRYTTGLMIGILSAVVLTFRNVLSKRLLKRYGGLHLLFYQCLTCAVLLAPFSFGDVVGASSRDWIYIIIAGIGFTALAHGLYVISLSRLTAATVSLVSCIQPLYGITAAFIILHEVPSLRTIVGGLIVISAVAVETLPVRRKEKL